MISEFSAGISNQDNVLEGGRFVRKKAHTSSPEEETRPKPAPVADVPTSPVAGAGAETHVYSPGVHN